MKIPHYEQLIPKVLETLPDEIDFTTYPVSKTIKRDVDLPLLKLDN